jgi:hypothetical protein
LVVFHASAASSVITDYTSYNIGQAVRVRLEPAARGAIS